MYDEFRHMIREHVFDKCWLLDITWAEVEQLLDAGEVVGQHVLGDGDVKEIRLTAGVGTAATRGVRL